MRGCPTKVTSTRPTTHSTLATLGMLAVLLAFRALPLAAQEAPVQVRQAQSAEIPKRIELSASVVSPRSAKISTDIGGLVQSVIVELGDRVEAGASLVQLDAALEQLELQQAAAAVDEARETLADADREARIGRQLAAKNNLAQNILDAREAEARIAAASLKRLEAVAAQRRERVKRHNIRAPFDGVVALRVANEGEWVTPGAAVVELVETARLYVDVPVPQIYYAQLGDSLRVTLRFDAMPGRTFPAEVVARVPVSDPTERTFTLRLRPKVDAGILIPGMSARVVLDYGAHARGVVVPRDAIIRYPDGRTSVWVVEADGETSTASEHLVELGPAFDGMVHIKSGLADGVSVVVHGNESLREGQRVRLTGDEG